MVYIQSLIQFLSVCRVAALSFFIFFLIQGILEIPLPHLSAQVLIVLAFAVLHGLTDTLNRYIFRSSRFTYTSVIVIVWLIFLYNTSLLSFMKDNSYGTQSLFCAVTLLVTILYLYQDLSRTFTLFAKIKIDSRIIIVGSFILVIFSGAGLLLLPIARSSSLTTISPVDAFFVATSAVCVTGLTVINISKDLSRFGQVIVLILIQIGSLGLVTITSVFINLLGKSMSMQGQLSAKTSFSSRLGDNSLQQFLRFALIFTLGTEGLLSAVLFARFAPDFLAQVPAVFPSKLVALEYTAYHSVFHAVSAFCNAGFSLYSDSLMRFRTDIVINYTIMFAIFAGGLGFLVWQDVLHYSQGRVIRLRLQSLVALRVSLFLIIAGTISYWAIERSFSLKGLEFWDQMLSSMFVSVNLRTAGFNTTNIGATSEAGRFLSCIIMYIGASPGSTGGGLKTTTFAILLATIRQFTDNQHDAVIAGHRVSGTFIAQAWFLFVNSLIWIASCVFALCLIEPLPLSSVMYEIFSAYSTVGVSTGITPNLSPISKIIVASTMIVGRVGPSTLILAFASKMSRQKLTLAPEEDIAVG